MCGIIHGPLSNKSNSRKLALVRGRPMFIKSQDARDYEERFEASIWDSLRNISPIVNAEKLYLKVTVYQENMRRDLDCELLPDLLQKFNIIKNDRLIWEKHYRREIDKANPRVEFEVGVIVERERCAKIAHDHAHGPTHTAGPCCGPMIEREIQEGR